VNDRYSLDDRKVYAELIDFAWFHVGGLATEARGVHLCFQEGYGQLMLTYWNHFGWTRKASIILPRPDCNESVELVFTFLFSGSFRDYCRYAHVMDRLVKSFRWESAGRAARVPSSGLQTN
jgi:hypothetical protein